MAGRADIAFDRIRQAEDSIVNSSRACASTGPTRTIITKGRRFHCGPQTRSAAYDGSRRMAYLTTRLYINRTADIDYFCGP
jgi:hypothetical protein